MTLREISITPRAHGKSHSRSVNRSNLTLLSGCPDVRSATLKLWRTDHLHGQKLAWPP